MAESHTQTPLLTERFQRAFALAAEVHRTQLRKTTTIPYLAHVMSVAALVLEFGGSEDAAIAGLLHDSIEDSSDGAAMETRLRTEFGDAVADIVVGCSDAAAVPGQDKPPWRARKEAYLAQMREETDSDVLLVSACDKLHNSRACVTDLMSVGGKLWDRFSGGKDGSLWYYQELSKSYDGKVPAALVRELTTAVEQMHRFAGPAPRASPTPRGL